MMTDAGSSSMNVVRFRWRQTTLFCSAIIALVVYNEWLVYYFVLLRCQWPTLKVETNDFTFDDEDGAASSQLRVMALADTHLLGSREGHWFDKLRRFVDIHVSLSFDANVVMHSRRTNKIKYLPLPVLLIKN